MEKIKYFDHAATTPVKDEVLKAMLPFFSIEYGNASSIYSIGRKSRKVLTESRKKVATAINAEPNEIYFTSGGSESDNLAIKGIARAHKNKGNHIITSKIEHPAVLNTCKTLEKEGFVVTYLNVNSQGFICLDELQNAIKPETILITIMFANNEIGTIQPINEIGRIAKLYNICFHTDAVQAIGNINVDVKKMDIDSLSMSAHKFYGPKGVGALYVRNETSFNKLQDGGHQEKDKRAGTENIAGIVGLGKAIEIAHENLEIYNNKLTKLRDYYIQKIFSTIPNVRLNGDKVNRLPGNANISFENIDGGDLVLKLDELGICASTGSACSSGADEPSHVLTSIGLPAKLAYGSLRTTFGSENSYEEIDYLVNALANICITNRNLN